MSTIGERIKQRRLELDLSIDDIAKKLGKNRATIYRYEGNDIENFPTTILETLASILKTTPWALMGWTDSSKNNPATSITTIRDPGISLYHSLDYEDKAEIRGTMKQMLKAEKYDDCITNEDIPLAAHLDDDFDEEAEEELNRLRKEQLESRAKNNRK